MAIVMYFQKLGVAKVKCQILEWHKQSGQKLEWQKQSFPQKGWCLPLSLHCLSSILLQIPFSFFVSPSCSSINGANQEDGRRAGCSPEDGSGDDELGLDDGRDGDKGELALGDGRASFSSGGSSSSKSTSSGGYDQPPRRRARIGEGDRSSRRRAPVKREEDSD
jgi:hypothetical protein